MNYVRKLPAVLFAKAFLLIFAAICTAETTEKPYTLGAEDTIVVSVARHPEFSGEYFIPADGIINVPGAGQIQTSGKTLAELADKIRSNLLTRLRDPEVTVSLKAPRMQRVYVLGSVDQPGLYDMKPGWRITEALAAAGGILEGVEAADCCVSVLRAGTREREQVKMADVLRGSPDANLTIQSGDVVSVEAVETIPIYVMGRVKNPGLYKLRKDSSRVIEAITLAGGTLEDAALDKITITRLSGKTEVINLAPAMIGSVQGTNSELQAGDLVVVPEETAKVAVLGYVNQPGFYTLKNSQKIFLSDALGLARGTDNKRGDISNIAVIRTIEGKQTRTIYNLRKFLTHGDAKQNPEILAGDVVYVPQVGKPDWDFVVRSLSAIGILINPFLN